MESIEQRVANLEAKTNEKEYSLDFGFKKEEKLYFESKEITQETEPECVFSKKFTPSYVRTFCVDNLMSAMESANERERMGILKELKEYTKESKVDNSIFWAKEPKEPKVFIKSEENVLKVASKMNLKIEDVHKMDDEEFSTTVEVVNALLVKDKVKSVISRLSTAIDREDTIITELSRIDKGDGSMTYTIGVN